MINCSDTWFRFSQHHSKSWYRRYAEGLDFYDTRACKYSLCKPFIVTFCLLCDNVEFFAKINTSREALLQRHTVFSRPSHTHIYGWLLDFQGQRPLPLPFLEGNVGAKVNGNVYFGGLWCIFGRFLDLQKPKIFLSHLRRSRGTVLSL